MEDFAGFFSDKCLDFSVRIVKLYKYLKFQKKEDVISKQLLRSGTSIGANAAEGNFAISTADLISKYSIALKEASESAYWLKLLLRTEYLNKEEYNSLNTDLDELIKILTSSIKKLREKK